MYSQFFKILKEMFEPRRLRTLHNEEFPVISTRHIVKSGGLVWVVHVARMKLHRNVGKVT
jgi:hypothetical protein